MAITCKICNKELDVFSGGRCRKCRQLVCKDCTADGGASSARGLLCKQCAQAEAALGGGTAPAAAPASAPAASWRLPAWAWIAGPLALALACGLAVGLPWLNALRHLSTLRTGEAAEAREASEALAVASGGYVFKELCAIVKNEEEPARSRAVAALGMIPSAPARDFLSGLQADGATPAELRSRIVEALREQERRGWRDPAPEGR